MNQETIQALASNKDELDTRALNAFEMKMSRWKTMDRGELEEIANTLHDLLRDYSEKDAETYENAWKELSNTDEVAANDLRRLVHELKERVASKTDAPCQTADIESVEQLRAAADVAGPKLHEFGKYIAKQCPGGCLLYTSPSPRDNR